MSDFAACNSTSISRQSHHSEGTFCMRSMMHVQVQFVEGWSKMTQFQAGNKLERAKVMNVLSKCLL